MTVNKARRVTAASCWILVVLCGCWPCERNECNFSPSARGLNLSILCEKATCRATGQRHRKRILTDREARALNQHQHDTQDEDHGSGSQVRTPNTKQKKNVNNCISSERRYDSATIKTRTNQVTKSARESNVEERSEQANKHNNQ